MTQEKTQKTNLEEKKERDIRLLADIIALILDKEGGEAHNAFAHLRQRAHHSEITGGALKNLFLELVKEYNIKNSLSFPSTNNKDHKNNDDKSHTIDHLQYQIKLLRNKQYDLQNIIRHLENNIQDLHHDNASFYYISSYQKIIIIIAIIFGILIGISLDKII